MLPSVKLHVLIALMLKVAFVFSSLHDARSGAESCFDNFCKHPSARFQRSCVAYKLGEELMTARRDLYYAFPELMINNSFHGLITECFMQETGKLTKNRPGDFNECELDNNGCDSSQECVNTLNSYFCVPRDKCNIGYAFNSKEISCQDIDECQSQPCEHFCQNSQGSFHCKCRRGFKIDPDDASRCIDIDECSEQKNLCSYYCLNTLGSFKCSCPQGFKLGLNQRSCEDIDECAGKRRVCGKKICNNLIGSFACFQPTCPDGYRVFHEEERRNDCLKCVRRCAINGLGCNTPGAEFWTIRNVTLQGRRRFSHRPIELHRISTSRFDFPITFKMIVAPTIGVRANSFEISLQPNEAVLKMTKPLKYSRWILIIVKVMNHREETIELVKVNLEIVKRLV